ncbi:MAG TPA: phospho-sugar mutase [Polyangiaceae bacterium]|nr:phospho-sugar mutase [Polyangiaceae bacterium]
MPELLMPDELERAARSWIAGDPDPITRSELQQLLEDGQRAELGERLGRSLEFGTAGLRGIVGAGPNRMNRAVVIRTTRALAEHVLQRVPDARSLPVVLGYDARLSSRSFAEDTAGVLAAAGLSVRYFEAPVPTPLVAYAVRALGASAGIVITASHNPPEYNGYKVYGPNGAQIIAPADAEITTRRTGIESAASVPRVAGVLDGQHPGAAPVPESLAERYLAELAALIPRSTLQRDLKIVYTPLHGVGGEWVERALRYFGFEALETVSAQAMPDGLFPTVRFPNPEEPGALDLALGLAQETKAELIVANDPDADRLAAAVPTATGRWQVLTGNQLGLLLADFALSNAAFVAKPLVVSSIVSSPMLASVAARHGAHFEQTLTGFKWIWNAALELELSRGLSFVFGYEEALGYSLGHLVRDKDGVSAAVLLCELAARCKERGMTLLDRLAELYREHGLWVSVQKSIVRPGVRGAEEIEQALAGLLQAPPEALAGRRVLEVTDYSRGAELRPHWLPQTALGALDLEGGARVLVRPSGTEPKLKIYVDLAVSVRSDETIIARNEQALTEANAIAEQTALVMGFH